MVDSPKLISKKPVLLIAEVKPGDCALNGPWTDRERGNMERVLRAVGLHDPSDIEEVAGELYDRYESLRPEADVRLCAVGRSSNRLLRNRPKVLTFTWTEIFEFIFDRFAVYGQVKRDNKQWDIVGRRLFRLVEQSLTRDEFVETAVGRLMVPERERL
jgi:hypothetical protein